MQENLFTTVELLKLAEVQELENEDVVERHIYLIYLAGGHVLEGRFAEGYERGNPKPDDGFQMYARIAYTYQGTRTISHPPQMVDKDELITVRWDAVVAWSRVRMPEEKINWDEYIC